jgi:hypothetical protein
VAFLNRHSSFFAPAEPLEPDALATHLEPEALAAPLGPNAPIAMCVIVADATRQGTVFVLSFTGLAEATSTSDGHFRLVFPHGAAAFADSPFFFLDTLMRLVGAFPTASTFLFFEASMKASKPGTGRGP